ncbi:PaaI family thioesterase [Jeotgalibacillus haloalkalitolerans]|uniref:PaaI family thioesterase n=1 Tax=Jeotgalibacillus haloalkalitolerans TaxID=3104292 RepID=A0ABU5KKR8_9BACL|nr:PaaI family thioesterase [Jeotgalibacillus sp. HH7-29]MDZ5711536.1 PaaI family thioesterase [Jeotgalibacillus sp. HH7-29]
MNTINQLSIDQLNDDEKNIIEQVLKGFESKRQGLTTSYVSAMYAMEHQFDGEILNISMPVTPIVYNSLGMMHGGITATAIDTAMGVLANKISPPDKAAVTNQLNLHYTAPIHTGSIQAFAKVIHHGSKSMVIEGWVETAEGKRAAHATGSFFIIDRK